MHWSTVSLTVFWASFVVAHTSDPSFEPREHRPRLAGERRFLSELKGTRLRDAPLKTRVVRVPTRQPGAHEELIEEKSVLDARQSNNKNGRCGGRYSACAPGYCCSAEGWCGLGEDYCTAPDCQLNYGPGCDGNQKPDGVDTSSIARPKVGKVLYGGVGIYDCVTQGDIAVTFDDGPYNFTNDLLDKLQKYDAKATFFITGTNNAKGQINDPNLPWRDIIQRMADEGHQIASHTWSHQNFSQLDTTQARNQMIWNEIAFNDILGYFPTYMRPPFSICESACQKMLADLGYHAIYFDLDTEGYLHDDPNQIQTSKDLWNEAVDGSNPCKESFLQIEHDIHYQVVYNLTDYILGSLFAHGYRSVTVGQCLGDPPENWYRAGSGSVPAYGFNTRQPTGTWTCLKPTSSTTKPTSSPITTTRVTTSSTRTSTTVSPTATLKVSTDGSCGNGVTCLGSKFGCSVNGYCGKSIDYCGNNCNPQFGTCAVADPSIPPRDETTTTSASTAAAPAPTLIVSTDGNCGDGVTCEGSQFGNCCSEYNYCGGTADYCLIGCQPGFGICGLPDTTTSSPAPAPPTTSISTSTSTTTRPSTPTTTTATSIKTTTTTTVGSTSTSFSTSFSTSRSTSRSTTTTRRTTSAPAPVPTALIPSPDGSCGVGTNFTCRGSLFGVCCSGDGQCGILCLLGDCQERYGICIFPSGPDAVPSSEMQTPVVEGA